MKQPLTYEEWVTKFVGNVATYFNLSGWTISVEFPDNPKETCYAENTIDSTYLGSVLRIYPQARKDFEDGKTDRIVMAVVHELSHLFFDPLHDAILPFLSQATTPAFMDILEQQTQKLTVVIIKNLPKGLIPLR